MVNKPNDGGSLSHKRLNCKYYIVFITKHRIKAILIMSCEHKEVEIIEAHKIVILVKVMIFLIF